MYWGCDNVVFPVGPAQHPRGNRDLFSLDVQLFSGRCYKWLEKINERDLCLFQLKIWSHFILGGFNYYVLTSKYTYNVLIVVILYCKTLLLLLRWDTDKVRGRFGSMGRFKDGLRCKGWVNSVIINVTTYRCKNNVKTCMCTISAMYQIINLNAST